jgi:hypothetical protein
VSTATRGFASQGGVIERASGLGGRLYGMLTPLFLVSMFTGRFAAVGSDASWWQKALGGIANLVKLPMTSVTGFTPQVLDTTPTLKPVRRFFGLLPAKIPSALGEGQQVKNGVLHQLVNVPDPTKARIAGQQVQGMAQVAASIHPRLGTAFSGIGKFAGETLGLGRLPGAKTIGALSPVDMLTLGMNGLSAARTAKNFGHRIAMVKEMEFQLTGKKPSTMSVLFGSRKLHPTVRQAHRELSVGGLASVMEIAATGAMGALTLFQQNMPTFLQSGPLANPTGRMLITSGLFMIPGLLKKGHSALDSYQVMHQMKAAGGQIPPEAYVGLIRGLAPKIGDEALERMAMSHYQAQSHPDEIMRIMAGTMHPNVPMGRFTARESARRTATQQQQYGIGTVA